MIDPAKRHISTRDFIPLVENNKMGRMIDCAMLWLGLAMLVKQSTLRM
ncbi:MAG: hypothetical protein ACKVIU_04715 [Rhodobacterales bacterium]